MFKFLLTDLNRKINEFSGVSKRYKFSKYLDSLLNRISKDILKGIKSNFKKRSDKPYASLVKNPYAEIKFRLPKSFSAPTIGKRSGNLEKSFVIKRGRYKHASSVAKGGKARFSYDIFVDSNKAPYVYLHNYGGVVKSKNAEKLAIPIHRESYGRSPREFSRVVFTKRFILKPVGNKYQPLYLRLKKVHMKKRLFIEDGIKKVDVDKYINELIDKIESFF